MPRDDAPATALPYTLAELQSLLNDPSVGRTVVAGPPDDASEMARAEILAALAGAPTPGAL